MDDVGALLGDTYRFMLGALEHELRVPLDWRASGGRHGPIGRAAIYVAAMARDLIRIPLHHPDGIAQARFRARVRFIDRTALPTVQFVQERFPVSDPQRAALGEAERELRSCAGLVTDGRFRRVDEWYATMDEFAELTAGCQRAADALTRAVAVDDGPDRPEKDGGDFGA